jgi:hypothetical protein
VGEAQPDRVALAATALCEDLDVALRARRGDPPAFLERTVVRVPLDEDQLRVGAESGQPPDHLRDIALLVAARTHDRDARGGRGRAETGGHRKLVHANQRSTGRWTRNRLASELRAEPERQQDVRARPQRLESARRSGFSTSSTVVQLM